jgi:hypothetical protein
MNKRQLSEIVGHIIRLRPNPIVKKSGKPIKETLNNWTFLDFPDQKRLIFQHNHSEYILEVEALYVRGHEPPDMLAIRGLFYLEDDSRFSFIPFTEGMSSTDARELTDDPTSKLSQHLYDALKPHEGKEVSLRFPKGEDGTWYGGYEAILKEVTPHYVLIHVPPVTISLPKWTQEKIQESAVRTSPGFDKSIALKFITLEVDTKNDRPMLVMDHSHRDREL